MKVWVGVTDRNWFEFLRARSPQEVNFWQPSARRRAAVLEPGTPFLFKLHAPHNVIVGGGFFVRYSSLPARLVSLIDRLMHRAEVVRIDGASYRAKEAQDRQAQRVAQRAAKAPVARSRKDAR